METHSERETHKSEINKRISPTNILVIQTAFLGDAVLTLPLLKGIHDIWEKAAIHVVTIPSNADLFRSQPYISRVYPYDKHKGSTGISAFIALVKQLRKTSFDYAIVPHRSARSTILTMYSRARRKTGYKEAAFNFLYNTTIARGFVSDPTPGMELEPEITRNLNLLPGWRNNLVDHLPQLVISKEIKENTRKWLQKNQLNKNEYVVFACGSIWPTKRWPEKSWIRLGKELRKSGYKILLVGGKDDRHVSENVQRAVGNGTLSAAGKFKVIESAQLISDAKLVITNDSAPLHLATAVRTPILAIFGPTVPEFGFAPVCKCDYVIGLDLPCRPCSLHGGAECPLKHHDCMQKLEPLSVAKVAMKMLGESPAASGDSR